MTEVKCQTCLLGASHADKRADTFYRCSDQIGDTHQGVQGGRVSGVRNGVYLMPRACVGGI